MRQGSEQPLDIRDPHLFLALGSTTNLVIWELLRRFDIKDVCNWLGNTPAVALKHYPRSDNDALRKATLAVSPPVAGDLNTPEPTGLAGIERTSIKQKRPTKNAHLAKSQS